MNWGAGRKKLSPDSYLLSPISYLQQSCLLSPAILTPISYLLSPISCLLTTGS
ncbi:hypothetical protein [Microcystis aeruginosa]|uniref:hypothetical protein n=1 Tax=Microcystis aeruginosa TaxID=1126 RepID=UPI0002F9B8D5|nr:hypothetical protein [Microcystis aeruginosa]